MYIYKVSPKTEIYTLSLHDALPIWKSNIGRSDATPYRSNWRKQRKPFTAMKTTSPRRTSCWSNKIGKSTRLNSSHPSISYAVFCLKKKTYKKYNKYTILYTTTASEL